jgi:hypothetical protein
MFRVNLQTATIAYISERPSPARRTRRTTPRVRAAALCVPFPRGDAETPRAATSGRCAYPSTRCFASAHAHLSTHPTCQRYSRHVWAGGVCGTVPGAYWARSAARMLFASLPSKITMGLHCGPSPPCTHRWTVPNRGLPPFDGFACTTFTSVAPSGAYVLPASVRSQGSSAWGRRAKKWCRWRAGTYHPCPRPPAVPDRCCTRHVAGTVQ